jgi:hypothetical protein
MGNLSRSETELTGRLALLQPTVGSALLAANQKRTYGTSMLEIGTFR